ncbi:autotransporter outer membrane beta-barrel domain-containing protein [Bartonella massiliensis]|uniref:autotransporter outer membrane beta-barrel domain-containing protein n=1 Tax=Bartonella massiliensis TaxID=929795 RepID=UPI00115810C4|nr:autotransporter outer membrane beta-barrel domain-containing protein [Bartonella massiliensis]
MHKNLLFCTTACVLFFSSFTFMSISHASSLSPQTRHALEEITKLPEQYRYAIDVMDTPTQAEKNLEMIASGVMMKNNSQVLQESLDETDRRINSYFSGLDRYGSGAHTNMLQKERDYIHAQAMANQYNQDMQTLLYSRTRQRRAYDKLPSVNVVSQHKDNAALKTDHGITQLGINKNTQSDFDPKTTLKTSAEDHVKLPTKIGNTRTAKAESTSPLTEDKTTATPSSLDKKANSKTLTPQIENSLIMPIAMFAVGVADVNNQNILLDNMQITMFEPKNYQEKSIFLSTYGNKNTFFSLFHSEQENSQTEQEGVQKEQGSIHADIRYAALQAGATLITRQDQNISTNFGLFGTYGKLSFTPKKAESFHKNIFDKWSFTAYGNVQHDSGIYASAFLSYGIFKENMSKDFIKDASKVNDKKTLGAAAVVGQKLSTSFEGVILEPQAQLVYQRLMLSSSSNDNSSSNDSASLDENNAKINIRNPHQWLLRIGGRLTQNKGHALSFYGKLNLIKTFSQNFQLAAMGSLVEGGFGIHAHLSQNIELHSDLSYQHKFKKVGISGINIAAGMRYHF